MIFNVTLRNGPMTWRGQVEASCSEEAIMRARMRQAKIKSRLPKWFTMPGFEKGPGMDFAAPVEGS